MMRRWTCVVRVRRGECQVLAVRPPGTDLLKARLPLAPPHPRALLTLLEGLALWSGYPLHVAVSVEDPSDTLGSGIFGDELFPGESQLVHWDLGSPGRRVALRGMGDFRALRRKHAKGHAA